jgi:hypothetical protein
MLDYFFIDPGPHTLTGSVKRIRNSLVLVSALVILISEPTSFNCTDVFESFARMPEVCILLRFGGLLPGQTTWGASSVPGPWSLCPVSEQNDTTGWQGLYFIGDFRFKTHNLPPNQYQYQYQYQNQNQNQTLQA